MHSKVRINTPGLIGFVDTEQRVDKNRWNIQSSQYKQVEKRNQRAYIKCFYQPFVKESLVASSGKVWVVFYGELYSAEQRVLNGLRSNANDAEKILWLYKNNELNRINNFNGSYNLFIWDDERKEGWLVNDRYGLRPMYYVQKGSVFFFSNDIYALYKLAGVSAIFDWQSISELFTIGYPLGYRTLFQEIKLVSAATILHITKDGLKSSNYWKPAYTERFDNQKDDGLIEEFHEKLKQSIKRQYKKGGTIGLPLSGGMDSRIIAGICDELDYHPTCFTFGIPNCYDIRFANQITNELNFSHEIVNLSPKYIINKGKDGVRVTGGMKNIFDMHILGLNDPMNKKNIDVDLCGSVGDLMTGAYINSEDNHQKDFGVYAEKLFKRYNQYFKSSELVKLNGLFPMDASRWSFIEELYSIKELSRINQSALFNLQTRQRRHILYGDCLRRMRFEVRDPFYDYDLFNFLLTLTVKDRLNQYLYKRLYKEKYYYLAKIPIQKTAMPLTSPQVMVDLRREISSIYRRLMSRLQRIRGGKVSYHHPRYFADYSGWIRQDPLRQFCFYYLFESKCLKSLFDMKYINQIWNEHQTKKADHTKHIGILITFSIFCEEFGI